MIVNLLKSFFGHTWWGLIFRIVLGVILYKLTQFFLAMSASDTPFTYGIPFEYYVPDYWDFPGREISIGMKTLAILGDVVVWYIVSCIVIFPFKIFWKIVKFFIK